MTPTAVTGAIGSRQLGLRRGLQRRLMAHAVPVLLMLKGDDRIQPVA
jgi:hypothetical protein